MPTQTLPRPTHRHTLDKLVDTSRLIDVARKYPHIENVALAERFGVAESTVRNVLKAAGISSESPSVKLVPANPVHPWRPEPRRRRTPQQIAMSKAERQAMVDAYLARNEVTKVPRGKMTTSDITFLDTIHE